MTPNLLQQIHGVCPVAWEYRTVRAQLMSCKAMLLESLPDQEKNKAI